MYENQKRYSAVAVANKLHIFETGTPSVQIQFRTIRNLTDDYDVQKILWGTLFLSDNTFDRTMETLTDVFGFNSDNIQDINKDTSLFAGIEVVLVTDQEEYEGRMKEKVVFINKAGGGVGKVLEDGEAAMLNKMLQNKIKAFHLKNGGKPATQPPKREPSQQPARQPVTTPLSQPQDDDLPF